MSKTPWESGYDCGYTAAKTVAELERWLGLLTVCATVITCVYLIF